jgi:hypothetical protein
MKLNDQRVRPPLEALPNLKVLSGIMEQTPPREISWGETPAPIYLPEGARTRTREGGKV